MKRLFIILGVLLLVSFTFHKGDDQEVITRLQIIQVTIEADVEDGKVDSVYAASYLYNIKRCLEILKDETSKTAKLDK